MCVKPRVSDKTPYLTNPSHLATRASIWAAQNTPGDWLGSGGCPASTYRPGSAIEFELYPP